MGKVSNLNRKISKMCLNSGKHKEAKEVENLKTENENKIWIIKSLLENVSQITSSHENQGKQSDIEVT